MTVPNEPISPSPQSSDGPSPDGNSTPSRPTEVLPDVQSMPVEKCFEELESIVAGLESSETSLEDSLRLFERGMKLSARCSAELNRVERRIQMIIENTQGEVQVRDFKADEDERGD